MLRFDSQWRWYNGIAVFFYVEIFKIQDLHPGSQIDIFYPTVCIDNESNTSAVTSSSPFPLVIHQPIIQSAWGMFTKY